MPEETLYNAWELHDRVELLGDNDGEGLSHGDLERRHLV